MYVYDVYVLLRIMRNVPLHTASEYILTVLSIRSPESYLLIPRKGSKLYQCRSLLIPYSSPHPSTKATTIDIAIYTKELCHPHTDLQPLSQGTPPSYSYHQLQYIKESNCTPAGREAPNDVDVLCCHGHEGASAMLTL